MTIFVSWLQSDDAAFRPAYLAATGEAIQDDPAVNADGDRYMVGSSRVTEAHCADLHAQFPDLVYGPDPAGFGWTPAAAD